jgi:Xaa-Pro aminopeptidase
MGQAIMAGNFIKKRADAICGLLDKSKIDCLIVTKPANVTYATGFMGDDSWAIITRQGRAYLVTDSRYTEQAQAECPDCRIIRRRQPIAEAAAKLIKKLKSVQTVGVESSTSLADFAAIRKNVSARLKTVADVIESSRSSKDAGEIAAITEAASIAAKALKQTMPQIKPGISESELAGVLDLEIRRLGARIGFDTIVAFGPNASRPHHQPTTRELRPADTILIDFGAKYKGYCCDITRCFAVGRPTALYKRAYDVVELAQAAAIKMVKAGAQMVKVDAAARDVICSSDLPVYGHGTGHGFGLEIHELPFVKPESKGRLKAGQVLTIEPGIYMPGKLGVRIEDDILVTRTGCRILTIDCPHRLMLY